MKNIFTVIFISILLLVFSRCSREKTTWYPEYAFPVAHGDLSFSDFNNTDVLDLGGEVVRIHYYDTLTPLDLTELIDLGDTVLSAVYTPGFMFGPFPYESGNTIFSLNEDFEFNLDGAELRSGKVKSGNLKVTFESDVQGYLDLSYTLEGITLDGVPLTVSGQTLPGTDLDPYENELFVDVSGYELDFTGSSGIERNTLTGELSVATSAEPIYTAQIYGDDEVTVKMELLDLEVEELRGYFGQWVKEIDEQIVIDSLIYQGGGFTLGEIDASLELINNFGVDVQVQLDELAAVNNYSSEEMVLYASGLNDLLNISRAIETEEGVLASSVLFEFDESSNLAEAISVTPNRFRLLGDFELNPLGDITGGFDFYLSDYPFQMVMDVSFPLCIGLENFSLVDSIDFSIDQSNSIESAKLKATITNSFPVGLDFSITSLGETEPFWEGQINSGQEGMDELQKIEIELSPERLLLLQQTDKIIVKVVANTLDSEEVKILTSDKIDILITAEITYEAEL